MSHKTIGKQRAGRGHIGPSRLVLATLIGAQLSMESRRGVHGPVSSVFDSNPYRNPVQTCCPHCSEEGEVNTATKEQYGIIHIVWTCCPHSLTVLLTFNPKVIAFLSHVQLLNQLWES